MAKSRGILAVASALVAVLYCCSVGIDAAVCQNASRYANVVPLCAEYLNNYEIQGGLVYFAADSPAFALESLISNAGFTASRSLQFVGEPCKSAIYPFVCRSVFPPCEKNLIVQKPLCYSSCQNVVDKCTGIIAAEQIPNCDTFDNTTMQPTYPEKYSTVVVNGETIKVDCYHAENDTEAPEFPFECVYPMINFDDDNIPDKEDWPFAWPCGLRCPFWIYTSNLDDYWDYYRVQNNVNRAAFGVVFLLGPTIIILMLIGRKYWFRYPVNLLFILNITVFIGQMGFFGVFASRIGWGGCVDYYTARSIWDAPCFISAFMEMITTSELMTWFVVICNVLGTLMFRGSPKYMFYSKCVSAFLVLAPWLSFVVMGISTEDWTGGGSVNGCFLTNHVKSFIYYTLAVLALGFIVFLFAVIYLWKMEGWKEIHKQYRFLAFVLIFGGLFSVEEMSLISRVAKQDRLTAALNEWLTCTITAWIGSISASAYDRDISGSCYFEDVMRIDANVSKGYVPFSFALVEIAFISLFLKELLTHAGLKNRSSSSSVYSSKATQRHRTTQRTANSAANSMNSGASSSNI